MSLYKPEQPTLTDLFRVEDRVLELENAIRKHRDQRSDDRCWMDDQELYAVLKDGNLGDNHVGDVEEMKKNCDRFLKNRCSNGKWKTYAELEDEIEIMSGLS